MKLAIIIPAFNEEKTIGEVLSKIPKKIKGISSIEKIVIDDGSTDKTFFIAKKSGAKIVIKNKKNLGLAKSFALGIEKAKKRKADIVVNIDADNQYDPLEIPYLIKPIINKHADLVIGNRTVRKLKHMPLVKKYGNIFGSWIISRLTGTKIQDASSGFRAFAKDCFSEFNLLSTHTYTHETIIQAINNNFHIEEIPVKFRKRNYGESRLINGVFNHIQKSISTILRTILMYKAFRYLLTLGFVIIGLGLLGVGRYLFFYIQGKSNGHVQSLVLSSILISIGFTTVVMGILADMIAINRKIIEKYLK